MLRLPRDGDPLMSEWARVLNSIILRREPRIISSLYDGSKWYVRYLAPYSSMWVQEHLQSSDDGGWTYDADNYVTSELIDCRTERMKDFEASLDFGPGYTLFLIPVQYDGEGNKILYDGISAEDRMVGLANCCHIPWDKIFGLYSMQVDEIEELTENGGITIASDIGFHGGTPISQPSAIADVSGGAVQDAEARTAINSVLAALRSYGLIATQ